MTRRVFVPVLVVLTLSAAPAWGAPEVPATAVVAPLDFEALPHVAAGDWRPISLVFEAAQAAQTGQGQAGQGQSGQPSAPMPRAKAFEYSDAYHTRAKIHRYASFATLPLFIAQYIEGDKLFDGEGGSTSTHQALAISIGTLFGVNSVTGVWNLWEARHDPNHRARRTTHGLIMLGCDAGFVATGLLAPGHGDQDARSLHRNVAVTSMAIASANFVFMLIANR